MYRRIRCPAGFANATKELGETTGDTAHAPNDSKESGDALKRHICDVSREWNRHNGTFQKTAREFAEYIGRELDEGGEFRTGLVNFKLPELIEPVPPNNPNTDKVGF